MGDLWDRGDVGVMLTPASGNRMHLLGPLVPFFAWDTGNFTKPVDPAAYLDLLAAHAAHRDRCLFATAPDVLHRDAAGRVVGDAAATWELSRPILPRIRALGYRAALVAQDGIESLPTDWDAFDCLFLGGSTAWKLSEHAYGLIAEAKRRGKHVHVGRVNSLIRLRAAAAAGADSADGTCLAFNPPQYVREIAGWLDQLKRQPPLPSGPAAVPPAAAPVGVPAAASPAAAAAPRFHESATESEGEPGPC